MSAIWDTEGRNRPEPPPLCTEIDRLRVQVKELSAFKDMATNLLFRWLAFYAAMGGSPEADFVCDTRKLTRGR